MNESLPDETILENIEKLGRVYKDIFLNEKLIDKKSLETNWWVALDFFFVHSFMRGRRDELSNDYYKFTITVLKEIFEINGGETNLDRSLEILMKMKKEGLLDKEHIKKHKKGNKNTFGDEKLKEKISQENSLIKQLTTERDPNSWRDVTGTNSKGICLNNDRDAIMVLDVLNFICEISDKNTYIYLRNKIKNDGTEKTFKKLVEIDQIGDKLASFVIRDIGLLNEGLIRNHFESAFPVDTWVMHIANKLGCPEQGAYESDNKYQTRIKKYFIDSCRGTIINPLYVATGIWILGVYSLEISIACIGNDISEALTKIEACIKKDKKEFDSR